MASNSGEMGRGQDDMRASALLATRCTLMLRTLKVSLEQTHDEMKVPSLASEA